jgi:hypothetical protein
MRSVENLESDALAACAVARVECRWGAVALGAMPRQLPSWRGTMVMVHAMQVATVMHQHHRAPQHTLRQLVRQLGVQCT